MLDTDLLVALDEGHVATGDFLNSDTDPNPPQNKITITKQQFQ